jgi:hypothetical protein
MRIWHSDKPSRSARLGFTLVEVIISVGIATLGIGGIVSGYIISAQRAEWSTCSGAAQLMAMGRMEQVRIARWDPFALTPVDELVSSNFLQRVDPLQMALVGTNAVSATTTVTINTLYVDPPLKAIRVDCVWSVLSRGPFTNSILTYRAAD